MLLPGTEIHIVVFIILLFEVVILFFQIIYFLSRPSEPKRRWFLILIFLLVFYNSVSGFLPDQNIPISITLQNILAYSGGVIMSMYFPVYIHKAFDLQKLKFYAYGGSVLFLLIPFLLLFIAPYLITGNLDLSRKLVVIVPFFFALAFLVALTKAFQFKYSLDGKLVLNTEVLGVYLGMIFWLTMPIIVYFDGSQLLENSSANAGFLVMGYLYINSVVKDSRREYTDLLISERRIRNIANELSEKVKERTLELEQANEQRMNTLINLAHETKTPLTLINNYMDEYTNKYGETEEFTIIKRSTNKLTKDIVNFFDLERISRGLHIYDHNQISNISTILSDNYILFKQYALKKNIQMTEMIEQGVLIKADPSSLDRIVNNLIENAIKYTPEGGGIEIRLSKNKDKISFSVKDHGIGISEEHQENIFNPYYQINLAKKNTQGMGLGLSIVKMIADELDATILVKSPNQQHQGTEILVEFHRYNLAKNEIISDYKNEQEVYVDVEKLQIKEHPFDTGKFTLLLVEDHTTMLNYMAGKLNMKYNIVYATSGSEALEKMKTLQNLDMIISDVMMDNGNGLELYREVYNQKRFAHIPFIFVTAKTDVDEKIEALAMGAIDYIQKPFMLEELINKIDSILNKLRENSRAIVEMAYKNIMNSNPQGEVKMKNDFENKLIQFKFTTRETEIIRLLINGHSTKLIADSIFISENTVHKHIQNIFGKGNVNNRIELLKILGVNNELL